MTWYYRIEVRFRTEGECIYRKKEADIPRIPDWSIYVEGGRTYKKGKSNSPAQLPCKKRTFRPNLYYKAYHVEYYAWHQTTSYGFVAMPSEDYLKWITQIINPLPNERFIESRSTRASIEPFIFHYADYYYQFEAVDGTIQPRLEKKEEGYFRRENLGNGRWDDVPVDDGIIRVIESRESAMKDLFPVVSRATNWNIKCLEELYAINPKDVEMRIGVGPMLLLEPSARKLGWGSNEYWDSLIIM